MRKYKKKYNLGGGVNPTGKFVDAASSLASNLGPAGAIAGTAMQLANSLLTNPSNYEPVRQNTVSGYNNGGGVSQESTAVRKPLINYNDFKPQPNIKVTGLDRFMSLAAHYGDERPYRDYVRQVSKANQGINSFNERIKGRGVTLEAPMSGGAGGSFNKGGDIMLNSNAVEVKGQGGIDNNQRVVAGQQVNLSKGETVQGTDYGAFVFSDSKDMLDPVSGKTFAKTAKKYQKAIGDAERSLKMNPSDPIAKATIRHSESQLSTLAERQQAMNGNYQGGDYNTGGLIPGLQNIFNTVQGLRSQVTQPLPSQGIPQLPTQPLPLSNVPGVTPPQNVSAAATPRNGLGTTLGDNVNLIADTASVLGKAIQAFQPAEQYDTDRYNVEAPRYNPNRALASNLRNFNAARFGINSGNPAVDSARQLTAYTAKLEGDRSTLREFEEMQNNADFQAAQANAQSRRIVDDINDQNEGARQAAIDNVFTSIANLGTEAQDFFNARTENNITLATLNSLSRRYGIDVSTLREMRKNNPDAFDRLLQFKG